MGTRVYSGSLDQLGWFGCTKIALTSISSQCMLMPMAKMEFCNMRAAQIAPCRGVLRSRSFLISSIKWKTWCAIFRKMGISQNLHLNIQPQLLTYRKIWVMQPGENKDIFSHLVEADMCPFVHIDAVGPHHDAGNFDYQHGPLALLLMSGGCSVG